MNVSVNHLYNLLDSAASALVMPANCILFVCHLVMLLIIWYRVVGCECEFRSRAKAVVCWLLHGVAQVASIAAVLWLSGGLIAVIAGLVLSAGQLLLFIFLHDIELYFWDIEWGLLDDGEDDELCEDTVGAFCDALCEKGLAERDDDGKPAVQVYRIKDK